MAKNKDSQFQLASLCCWAPLVAFEHFETVEHSETVVVEHSMTVTKDDAGGIEFEEMKML